MVSRLPRTTLEQWAVLRAVVEHGSFEAAAEALGRSQSSVSYAIRRLQAQIPVALLAQRGRRAVLTAAGESMLRRAVALLEEAGRLEHQASMLASGWEPEVRLAVDHVFPVERLMGALEQLGRRAPQTRVQVYESVLSGVNEVLLLREADLAVSGSVPPGFLADPLVQVEFVAVARRDHPLHRLGRPLSATDLRNHRQVVIRDTGVHRQVDAGWLGAEQRWTLSHLRTAIEAVRGGLAFAWIPADHIRAELAAGDLLPLALREGGSQRSQLYLVYADRDGAGPATRALAQALRGGNA